jgi:PAS domain S-box-containing protein
MLRPTPAQAQAALGAYTPGRIPLLLVDDHPENLTALEALLSALPFELELVMAQSGNEALRHSLKSDFALILLDVQMPDMNGLETAALLRSNPKTRHLPIIFVTAGMNELGQQFQGYESGAVDYLIKPIEPLVLQSKVRVFCELYAQRIELDFRKRHLEAMVQARTDELTVLTRTLTEEVLARRASELALQESELRVRAVIDSANEAFIGIDADGIIFDWNRRAEIVFGWARDEALTRPVVELIIPPQYRQPHLAGMRRFLATGDGPVLNRCIEVSALHRDGHEFPVELSIWQIPHARCPIFGAFVRDITERKHADALLQQLNESLERRVEERTLDLRRAMDQIVESEKLASLGGIVAGVAHELTTPIGNMMLMASTMEERIVGLAGTANQGKLTKSALDAFLAESANAGKVIVRSAERASVLIESFKQIAVDQTSQRRRNFDLRELAADILNTLGTEMRHAHATSELRIPPDIEMNSFPGDLEQILTNLITNSLRHGFRDRGEGKITIGAHTDGEQVSIIYQDDGVGIAPELHRKVFEPFYTTRLGQGGSGLGMFIVHNLVHGPLKGEIRIDSQCGQGVKFTVIVPLVTPAVALEA